MKLMTKLNCTRLGLALTITGLGVGAAVASVPVFETLPLTVISGGQGSACPGRFYSYTSMTNSAGSIWITPPAGTTNGILTDISGYPAPYASVATVMRRSDMMTWCAGNYVDFPVTSGEKFQLKVFVIAGQPTNGLPATLQIQWQ